MVVKKGCWKQPSTPPPFLASFSPIKEGGSKEEEEKEEPCIYIRWRESGAELKTAWGDMEEPVTAS